MDDKVSAFLQALWRGAPHANYWRSSDKQAQWFPVFPPVDCALGDTNIYFSVHPAKAMRGKFERTRIEDVACINCLFCEWDIKDLGSAENVREHVKALAIQPQVIVWSGGGAHGYWFIDEPMPVAFDGLVYLKGIQAAWVRMNGGDPGAKDLARVLRLPGTSNAKYTPHRPVTFSRFNLLSEPRYKLTDLFAVAEMFWEDEPTDALSPEPTIEHGQSNGAIAAIVRTFGDAKEGERNKLLLWAACKLYEHGMTENGVSGELQAVALRLGLTDKETKATIHSASKQPAKPSTRPPDPYQSRMPTRARSLDGAVQNIDRKYQS